MSARLVALDAGPSAIDGSGRLVQMRLDGWEICALQKENLLLRELCALGGFYVTISLSSLGFN